MVVVLQPVALPDVGTVSGVSQLTVTAREKTFELCPIRTRERAIVVDQGVAATIQWEMRDTDGNAVDLTSVFACSQQLGLDTCGQIIFRAVDALQIDGQPPIQQVVGSVVSLASGLVQLMLPATFVQVAGLYRFQIAAVDQANLPVFVNTGLLAVERGLFGDTTQLDGPPTLGEIRLHMRDTAGENSLLDEIEFSDSEIIYAITRPLEEWNDSPPIIPPRMTCSNFPYRYQWKNAIIAELLTFAAHHYRRNKLIGAAAGVEINDKDKDNPYLQVAMAMRQEWRTWLKDAKVSLNCRRAFGAVQSTYRGRYY